MHNSKKDKTTSKQEREEHLTQKLKQMKLYEEELYQKGNTYIAGVDEAGRGPLAGPVVAAAVILPRDFQVLGVDDSKKLSPKKREALFCQIKQEAIAYGLGIVDHKTIDQINILNATKEAMEKAIYQTVQNLQQQKLMEEEQLPKNTVATDHLQQDTVVIDHLLLDAITLQNVRIPQTSIIKGDANSISIAAASILAKVIRDRMMRSFAQIYPHYAFENNKGYGTKAHYQGLQTHGFCPIHRRTFLKNI